MQYTIYNYNQLSSQSLLDICGDIVKSNKINNNQNNINYNPNNNKDNKDKVRVYKELKTSWKQVENNSDHLIILESKSVSGIKK